jgi:hypothetical protein
VPRIAYIPSRNSRCFVPAKPEEPIGNSHKLSQIERVLDSPLHLPKGEDEGEGLFFCCSFECEPDCPQHAVELLANLMIPESQHNKSIAAQEFGPRSIVSLACTVVMSAAVQFDGQLCARTIEIQNVTVERMLTAKFVACELSVP